MSIPVHIALEDATGQMFAAELAHIAGALNEQIQDDFAPIWRTRATVGAYPAGDAPAGTWRVIIERQLDEPGALGYHTDEHGQPVAYVELTPDVSVTISHEVLEALADPFGYRMHGARLPQGLEDRFAEFGLKHRASHVHYLLEVCDPCEARSYEVGGVAVSDFLRPSWYRTNPGLGAAYSFAGICVSPRQVAPGGYVSFANLDSGEWYQAFNEGGALTVKDLGRFDRGASGGESITVPGAASLREWTDRHARAFRAG